MKIKVVFNVKKPDLISIELRKGSELIDSEDLTISQGFDTLLISVLDKLLSRNNIDRLSLKSLEIQGDLREEAVSAMILKTAKSALGV